MRNIPEIINRLKVIVDEVKQIKPLQGNELYSIPYALGALEEAIQHLTEANGGQDTFTKEEIDYLNDVETKPKKPFNISDHEYQQFWKANPNLFSDPLYGINPKLEDNWDNKFTGKTYEEWINNSNFFNDSSQWRFSSDPFHLPERNTDRKDKEWVEKWLDGNAVSDEQRDSMRKKLYKKYNIKE